MTRLVFISFFSFSFLVTSACVLCDVLALTIVSQSDNANFDGVEGFAQDHLDSHGNLEDLCRSHLVNLISYLSLHMLIFEDLAMP